MLTKRSNQLLKLDQRGSVVGAEPYFGNSPFPTPGLFQRFIFQGSKIPVDRIVLGFGIAVWVMLLGLGVQFFRPKTAVFSYSQPSCILNPVVLPRLATQQTSSTFQLSYKPALSAFGYPLFSSRTCLTPLKAPVSTSSENLHLQAFDNPWLKSSFSIPSVKAPTLNARFALESPVSTRSPFKFEASQSDAVFTYHLESGKLSAACTSADKNITCNPTKLNLAQGKNQQIRLVRYFKDTPAGTVFQASVTTIEPLAVSGTSIKDGSTVYEIPNSVDITFSKSLDSAKITIEKITGQKRELVATKVKITDKTAHVSFDKPLDRSQKFELIISEAEGLDKSHIETSFKLAFTMSGGPKVTGVNIGNYKVGLDQNIVLQFDVGLKPGQDLGSLITVEAGGHKVAVGVTLSGQTVVINPTSSLPFCSSFTIKVAGGLVNQYGVGVGEAWQKQSRSICRTVFSIGTSAMGRSITAYKFGSGASTVLLVGGTHGNEKSSVYILNSFIEYLEANAPSIPSGRSVVVIPAINPDGYAAGSRFNANSVDLNRNFPANNWTSGVYVPGNVFVPGGGGTSSLSEPESKALAGYISGLNLRLVLTYHATAGYVIANDSGDSYAQALAYGKKAGLVAASNSQGGVFDYDSTGEFEDWLHDKLGIPALLIELDTMNYDEFGSNRSAMWAMVQLP